MNGTPQPWTLEQLEALARRKLFDAIKDQQPAAAAERARELYRLLLQHRRLDKGNESALHAARPTQVAVVDCPICKGRGQVWDVILAGRPYLVTCERCGGMGRVRTDGNEADN